MLVRQATSATLPKRTAEGQRWVEPDASESDRLMTNVAAALEQQTLDVPQRQWVVDIHHTTRRMTSGDELK
jgi:hypothetical protein